MRFLIAFAVILGLPLIAYPQGPQYQQYLFVAEQASNTIDAFTVNPVTGTIIAAPASPFSDTNGPVALAANPAGTFLFVANFAASNVSVFSIAPNGSLQEIPGSPFATGDATEPSALAVSNDGQFLFVANSYSNADPNTGLLDVYSIGADGALTTLPSLPAPAPCPSVGMFVSPTGPYLYVLGQTVVQVYEINQGTPTETTALVLPTGNANSLVGNSQFLFVSGNPPASQNGFIDSLQINSDGSLSIAALYSAGLFNLETNLALAEGFLYSNQNTYQIAPNGDLTPTNLNWINSPASPLAASPTAPFLFQGSQPQFTNLVYPFLIANDGSLTNSEPPRILAGVPTSLIVVPSSVLASTGPALVFEPTSFDFNPVVAGQNSVAQLTVYSTGSVALGISDISVTGAGFTEQSSTCPASLAPSQPCFVDVAFGPSAAGNFIGTLTLTGNVSGSVALTGTGLAAPPPTQYTLATSVVGPGSIQQTPTGATFTANTEITLTAIPGANSTFTSWTGACAGSSNPVCSFSIAANTTLVATFSANPPPTQYQLSVSVNGPGTVSPQSGSYAAGTAVVITASPTGTAAFSGWSGMECGGTNLTCAFSMPAANVSIVATFAAASTPPPSPTPTITVTPTQQSGNPGGQFVYTVASAGFSTAPTIAAACSIPMGSCAVNGSTLTVTTTAPSTALVHKIPWQLPVGLTLLALFCLPSRKRKAIICVGALCALAACGSAPKSATVTQTPSAGTTAGNYAITISAAAGSQKATVAATLTIQ